MRILVANPNSNKELTELLMKSARKAITNPTTELIPFTNPKGSPHIDSVFGDYQSSWSFVRAIMLRKEELEFDALVIAGFGNFAMNALKEALDVPVISIAEASQFYASMLGNRYSVLTVLEQNVPYQEDLTRLLRLNEFCASIRGVNVETMRAVTSQEIEDALNKEIDLLIKDGAEVVVLGGARFATYSEKLSKAKGIPVIDPVAIGVKHAESLVELGLSQSKAMKYNFPPQPIDNYFIDGEDF